MGIRDKINELLGGAAVGGHGPDDDAHAHKVDDVIDKEAAVEDVSIDIETNKEDAYDRIHRMPGSDSEIPH